MRRLAVQSVELAREFGAITAKDIVAAHGCSRATANEALSLARQLHWLFRAAHGVYILNPRMAKTG